MGPIAELNPVQTSDGMSFALFLEGPAVHALNRRIAAATGTGVARGESLQVLRYRPGQEYKPHFDAVPGEANQRIPTMPVYLNHGYDRGETLFLKTGLSFKGGKGDALLFRNTLADSRADALTRHAGRPSPPAKSSSPRAGSGPGPSPFRRRARCSTSEWSFCAISSGNGRA